VAQDGGDAGDDEEGESSSGEREERPPAEAEGADAEGPFDEAPGEGSKDERGDEFDEDVVVLGRQVVEVSLGDGGGHGEEDAHLVQDDDGPVPEVERVRDETDEDDRPERENGADEGRAGLSGGDDERCSEA
jgi:hypothetical protein